MSDASSLFDTYLPGFVAYQIYCKCINKLCARCSLHALVMTVISPGLDKKSNDMCNPKFHFVRGNFPGD